ncbi:hypothetical protein FRX31_002359 [Thalictrum thalictroides]|uniref:Uncharacterized protein n=1 Tax=Thalictrum thalictroides TaxID=46969 RepID=A0A7J6XE78_THATH|nr:hypothetical protein FRX31_002359 [Thalictrum thalictroides]
MGNTESNDDTTRDEYLQRPSFRTESSMDFRHRHQPPQTVDVEPHHQSQRIDDNFSSLDQQPSADLQWRPRIML